MSEFNYMSLFNAFCYCTKLKVALPYLYRSVCGTLRFDVRLCCVVVCRLRPCDGPIYLPRNNLTRWL